LPMIYSIHVSSPPPTRHGQVLCYTGHQNAQKRWKAEPRKTPCNPWKTAGQQKSRNEKRRGAAKDNINRRRPASITLCQPWPQPDRLPRPSYDASRKKGQGRIIAHFQNLQGTRDDSFHYPNTYLLQYLAHNLGCLLVCLEQLLTLLALGLDCVVLVQELLEEILLVQR